MFRRYLLTPCCAPPDVGAGGGAAPAATPAGAPASGDAGGDDSALDAGDDDAGDLGQDASGADDGDDDEDLREREALLDALPVEEREKRARTWNRAASRKLRKLAPIADALRGPDGRYLSSGDVQRMRQDAQDMRELNEFFGEHPDVVQQILERKNAKGGGRAAAPAYQDPYANEEAIPLDMKDEASRYVVQQLRDLHKTNHDLREELASLKGLAGNIQQNDVKRSLAAIEQTWQSTTIAAARDAGLDGAMRNAFVNSVWKTFELAKSRNILRKVDLKQVIQRELQLLGANANRRRSVADTARRAERVTQIPRPAGRGQTAATTPADTNKNTGTIKDARTSFFKRLGQAATPR